VDVIDPNEMRVGVMSVLEKFMNCGWNASDLLTPQHVDGTGPNPNLRHLAFPLLVPQARSCARQDIHRPANRNLLASTFGRQVERCPETLGEPSYHQWRDRVADLPSDLGRVADERILVRESLQARRFSGRNGSILLWVGEATFGNVGAPRG